MRITTVVLPSGETFLKLLNNSRIVKEDGVFTVCPDLLANA